LSSKETAKREERERERERREREREKRREERREESVRCSNEVAKDIFEGFVHMETIPFRQ